VNRQSKAGWSPRTPGSSRTSGLLALLIAFVSAWQFASAQTTDDQPPSYRVRSYSALLEVRVLDPEGRPVSGLTVGDFTVRAAGKPRPVVLFEEHQDSPVSLVILVDVGSTMSDEKVGKAKQAILELIHLLDRNDEIALAVYAGETVFLSELTTDRLQLLDALTNTSASGKAGFWKRLGTVFASNALTGPAIDEALLRLKKAEHEVHVVLLFSAAFGNLGRATVDHVLLAGARVFAVGWPNRTGDAFNLWGDRISRNEVIAESGGTAFSGARILERIDSVARTLKSYYLLAYDPPEGEEKGTPEVRIPGQPGLKVTVLRRVASQNAFY